MTENHTPAFRLLDIDDAESGILAYALGEGKLSEEDVASIWQRFESAKAAGTKVRLYCEFKASPSTSGSMVLDKMKRMKTIFSTLDRMAVVGDKGWMGIYEKIVDPITKADFRHFTTDQRDEAIAWIRD